MTPMMKQYLEIKEHYQDAILFFRLGDFYEMFYEDAQTAAKELEITLTGRGQGEDRIPMCGVPHHSADNYMTQLIDKGYKVAICEQVEDPKMVKGVVKREVTKLLTPGTLMNSKLLSERENNFLVAIAVADDTFGVARCDLSTGESDVTLINGTLDDLLDEIATSRSKEVVAPFEVEELLNASFAHNRSMLISYRQYEEPLDEYQHLLTNIDHPVLQKAYYRLLHYLVETQKQSLHHLQQATFLSTDDYLKLDIHAKRNLELVETLREKKKQGSLLSVIDQTVTSMGGRLMRQWMDRPLVRPRAIRERQEIVEQFYHAFFEREALRDLLKEVYDIERLAARIAYGSVNARELVQLKRSLKKLPDIKAQLDSLAINKNWLQSIETYETLVHLLTNSIVEDPPISLTDGGILIDGYNEELDRYRDASKNGKQWIAQLEQQEREFTGIRSLKVGYNKVFGYYIEVSRANTHLLPEGRYERKQTLTNAERYITPELKEKEALILEAEESLTELEYQLFIDIRTIVQEYVPSLQKLATEISEMDVLASFAMVAEKQQYVKPNVTETRQIDIIQGRHPVVETVIQRGTYVENDIDLTDERDMLLITGPNMGGKSTYMRQLALSAILTQIGSFVPAKKATMPIFDRIFTRIGAADDLASGQSTFMVEMMETKDALTKATANSLIILDEIGRGTSTYDGMALAQAIIEYIHESIGAKTLFSTHYHELTDLAKSIPTLRNVHVSAAEEDGTVVFLHQIIEGAADRSYGVYVAELAGLPDSVTKRANELLLTFEAKPTNATQQHTVTHEEVAATYEEAEQLSLFQMKEEKKDGKTKKEQSVLKALQELDLLHVTPFDIIKKVNEWQMQLRKK
ncbi:DNA mismatch repair protein MutS [Shouchella lehensis]|uniref:DNA mismatch repair protein MutS n=1 Tax=Shouchella lehensis G1 TaxID=1246626 RepID=A0A060M2H0_9BACI|nr:DNA mismatch repair protein MutS [Shouchella lehensis]AIC94753.1 DNA mismatch repair protein MutS [Shouchella lehensis G1]